MTNWRDIVVTNLTSYACDRGLDIHCETDALMFDVIHIIFTSNNGDVRRFKYYDFKDPTDFTEYVISEIENAWFPKEEPKPKLTGDQYREQLVEQIKAAGQDLIDRAESFVAADLDTIGGFNIEIDIPQDGPVEIVTRMKTYCKSDKYYTTSAKGE